LKKKKKTGGCKKEREGLIRALLTRTGKREGAQKREKERNERCDRRN